MPLAGVIEKLIRFTLMFWKPSLKNSATSERSLRVKQDSILQKPENRGILFFFKLKVCQLVQLSVPSRHKLHKTNNNNRKEKRN